MDTLRRVMIKGFKSIRDIDLELRRLNVFIGSNGAGKSNLVSFFNMLKEMMGGRLQQYIAVVGRAHSLLHYGPKITPQLEARLEFERPTGLSAYEFTLGYAAGDTLYFVDEAIRSARTASTRGSEGIGLGGGHLESQIVSEAGRKEGEAIVIWGLIDEFWRVFHFHDTSATARVRQYGYIGDNRWLMPDGGNLAAFLYRLQNQDQGVAYRRIVNTIRMIAPFFDDFALQPTGPNGREIILNWRDKELDQIFGPHQLSDGTLRAMCLVALLLQPQLELPQLIIVDEPELGLHPYALSVIASLFKKVSHNAQVLISTQSSTFLDNFDPVDVIVVDREGKESVFRRPDPVALEAWLEEYSLGEVWEKNVIGGGPH
jgi:predicted ATPase